MLVALTIFHRSLQSHLSFLFYNFFCDLRVDVNTILIHYFLSCTLRTFSLAIFPLCSFIHCFFLFVFLSYLSLISLQNYLLMSIPLHDTTFYGSTCSRFYISAFIGFSTCPYDRKKAKFFIKLITYASAI